MRPGLLVSRFLLVSLLIYGAFLALWGAWGEAYAHTFRMTIGGLFRSVVSGGLVRVEPLASPTAMWDSELVLINRNTGVEGAQPFGTHYLGYAPTALLVALVLASPVPWSRRMLALGWGLLLYHVWIAAGLGMMIVDGYSGMPELELIRTGPWTKRIVSFVTMTMTKSTVTRYAVPALFWVMVTFRSDEVRRLRAQAGGEKSA